MQVKDVHVLIDHYYGLRGNAEDQQWLRLDPNASLSATAAKYNISVDTQELELLSALFSETSRLATELGVMQQMRTKSRLEASLAAMCRVNRLSLAMDTVLFSAGILLTLVAAYLALEGRLGSAAAVGGIGVLNLAFYFFKEPVASMQQSAASLLQLRTAYDLYFHELTQLGVVYEYASGTDWLLPKASAASLVFQATRAAASLIEKYSKPHTMRRPEPREKDPNISQGEGNDAPR